jgi:hypothetical protein
MTEVLVSRFPIKLPEDLEEDVVDAAKWIQQLALGYHQQYPEDSLGRCVQRAADYLSKTPLYAPVRIGGDMDRRLIEAMYGLAAGFVFAGRRA